MEQEQDIRWIQRYDSFQKALNRIIEVTESPKKPNELSELEQEGLIQRFEYTFELAWKVLQDILKYKGYEFIQGPNGTLQKAFEDGLISNHDAWRKMSKARVITSHIYSSEEALAVVESVYQEYSGLLKSLKNTLEKEKIRLSKGY